MKNVGLEQRRASNRLSSGYRINSAADDAAGLAISETMRAQIRGLDQASRNAQDGQAMLLTTEGGLEEIGNMLQRVRELLVQAANDTNTQNQREMIEQEIFQLSQEIGSMQNRVEFNTNRVLAMGPTMDTEVLEDIRLLQADALTMTEIFTAIEERRGLIQEAREILSAMSGLTSAEDAMANARLNLIWTRLGVDFDLEAEGAIFSLDIDDEDVVNRTHELGADLEEIEVEFTVAGETLTISLDDLEAIRDTAELVNVTGMLAALAAFDELLTGEDGVVSHLNGIRSEMTEDTVDIYDDVRDFRNAATSGNNMAFFQVGANSAQGIRYDFELVSRTVSAAASITLVAATMVANPGVGSGIGSGMDVSSLINMINSSLDDVNRVRADLGAVQNRMDFTMRSLDISSENLQDSESRVRNADVAREMMAFTKTNVLQQAAVSMLSQANQLPNNLLQLLR